MSDRFDIAFGPGDCVCSDFADPRRLSSINLPPMLEKILKEWSAEKPDPYSDSESESESDTASRRRALSRSVSSSSESESEKRKREPIVLREDNQKKENEASRSRERSRSVPRERSRSVPRERSRSVSRERSRRASRERSRSRHGEIIVISRGRKAKSNGGYPKISCLAFGSRLGEYAMVYYDEGRWYLGTFLNPFTHAIGCDD